MSGTDTGGVGGAGAVGNGGAGGGVAGSGVAGAGAVGRGAAGVGVAGVSVAGARATRDWPHLWRDGDADRPVLLMLHGTGGNEIEIARLADLLDPHAAVLAPRGRVLEKGLTRWFRRHGEGVFDVDDVVARAAELTRFLADARSDYGFEGRRVVAVGLSNGANIALAAALLHPDAVSRVVAFSGMFPLDDRPLDTDLSGSKVLLLNGWVDPMAPTASVDRLHSVLVARQASVTLRRRPGGHGITQQDLDTAQEWIRTA